MAKAIYVCSRNRPLGPEDEERLRGICEALTPDNIFTAVSHSVLTDDRIGYAVVNQQPPNLEKENSLLLGYLYAGKERWDVPLSDPPDGSFAIFRCSDDYFEALSDPVASRTIWYYFDEERFIAATSQRAIVMFLGSFEFDDRVIPWMLSSGTLGPEQSWDSRLVRLQADSSVVLDRKSWKISNRTTPFRINQQDHSDAVYRARLKEAIDITMGSLADLGPGEWVVPLSGGYDSRAILCLLKDSGFGAENINAITWGLEHSFEEKGNDAYVARAVANELGAGHRFYLTEESDESVSAIVDRFLLCVEGRSDHLSGYIDGMKIWSGLLGEGVAGLIKGDEGFGWLPVFSVPTVRYSIGCPLCSDYRNLSGVIEKFGLARQDFPEDLKQKDESLETWRDRLYHTWRIPVFVAAMSDIKFSYFEQITPLLSRSILEKVKELPDRLRTGKFLFKEIVDSISPDIPFADKGANASLLEIAGSERFVQMLHEKLGSAYARSLFSEEFLSWIDNGIKKGDMPRYGRSGSLKKSLKKLIPRSIKGRILGSGSVKPGLDGTLVAFRVFIIIRMHEILSEDCNKFSVS